MNICSTSPVTVKLSATDYEVMQKSGLVLEMRPEMSVRLDESHSAAIKSIRDSNSTPGFLMSRAGAIRVALHRYCGELTQGRRYTSFTDLVRDALLWTVQEGS